MNKVNTLSANNVHKVRSGVMDTLINTFMYLREDYPDQTKNFRTSWARRRHTNNYLYLSNVLINWAKEYRFYRNYNRSLNFQFFTKNCYLSVNISIGRSSLTPRSRFHRSVIGSSIPTRLMRFFQKQFLKTRFNLLLHVQPSVWSYSSYLEPYDTSIDSHNGAPYLPVLHATLGSDQIAVSDTKKMTFVTHILLLVSNLFLAKLAQIYGLLVKLVVFQNLINF